MMGEQIVSLLLDMGNMEYDPTNSSLKEMNRQGKDIRKLENDKKEDNSKNIDHPEVANFQTSSGTPLSLASCRGLLSVAKILLDIGKVNVDNSRDEKCMTPLMIAAALGDENMKLLLEYGANVHSRDEEGRTALFHAVIANNLGAVQLLFDNNAEICVHRKEDGLTPLHVAISSKKLEMLDLLLSQSKSEATVKWADATGRSLLIYALNVGATNEILHSVIEAPGINLNVGDNHKINAVAKMALAGNRDIFYKLVEKKAHYRPSYIDHELFHVYAAERDVPSDILDALLKSDSSLYLGTILFNLDENGLSTHRLWNELEKRKSRRNEEIKMGGEADENELEAENRIRERLRSLIQMKGGALKYKFMFEEEV